jgi:hypothetical protein
VFPSPARKRMHHEALAADPTGATNGKSSGADATLHANRRPRLCGHRVVKVACHDEAGWKQNRSDKATPLDLGFDKGPGCGA